MATIGNIEMVHSTVNSTYTYVIKMFKVKGLRISALYRLETRSSAHIERVWVRYHAPIDNVSCLVGRKSESLLFTLKYYCIPLVQCTICSNLIQRMSCGRNQENKNI